MEKLSVLLDRRPVHFYKISPECSLGYALNQMSNQNTQWLTVMNEEEHLLGIITENDIVRKAILFDLPIRGISVKEVMSTQFPFADVNDTIEHAMRLLKHFHVHCLPVFKEMKFCGIISTEDILKEAVDRRLAIFDEN